MTIFNDIAHLINKWDHPLEDDEREALDTLKEIIHDHQLHVANAVLSKAAVNDLLEGLTIFKQNKSF